MPETSSEKTPSDNSDKDWQVLVQREETPKKSPAAARPLSGQHKPAGRPPTPSPVVKIVVSLVLVVGLAALVIGVALGPRARGRRRTAADARIISPQPAPAPTPRDTRPPAPSPTAPATRDPGDAAPPPAASAKTYTGNVYGMGSKGDGKVKLNGKTVYVPGTSIGDDVVFSIVEERDTYAFGKLISKKAAPVEAAAPAPDGGEKPVFRAVVEELGSKGDARMRANGKTVYVPGAGVGDDISFVIADDRGGFAIGKLVEKHKAGDGTPPAVREPGPPPDPTKVLVGEECTADAIREGQQFTVTITEKERRNPDKNGVTRIGGMVVIVPDTQPGDKALIRITRRLERLAFSELIEKQ